MLKYKVEKCTGVRDGRYRPDRPVEELMKAPKLPGCEQAAKWVCTIYVYVRDANQAEGSETMLPLFLTCPRDAQGPVEEIKISWLNPCKHA